MTHDETLTPLQTFATALAVVAALLVAAAWVVLRFVLGDVSVQAMAPPWPGLFAGAAAAALIAAPLAERRLMGAAVAPPVFATYRRAKVVGFVLRALVAANGFLLALGTGRIAWSFALSTAALIAMALAWPRASDLGGGER